MIPFLISCATTTYKAKMASYYHKVQTGHFQSAKASLEENSFIQQKRNQLLYYFEKGKLYHLTKQYDSSNLYLNNADILIEQTRKNAGDIAAANLINPMMQTYLGEDFEPFMMHYYKALNYLYLGKIENAVVEARRIQLTTQTQNDKFAGKLTRYSKDAFALNLQGIIYEINGDINNAFIAYRNAVELYLSNNGSYYNVQMPKQLKRDVIKTALQMGFTGEATKYKNLFSIDSIAASNTNELIVFVEQGWIAEKKQRNLFVTRDNAGISSLFFIDSDGSRVQVPFDVNAYRELRSSDITASSFRILKVSIPFYSINSEYQKVNVVINNTNYATEITQNLNSLAVNILQERMFKEIGNAVVRQITKKLAEKGIEAGTKAVVENNSKEKDDKKKKENAEAAGAVAGLLVNILNTATEKADTRNWQSLPAFISYVRIPLQTGENKLTLQFGNQQKNITIQSTQKLQVYNWVIN